MTARDFDPVLSAALRNELEALADRAADARTAAPHHVPRLRRAQVRITVATVLLLVAATFGAVRLTAPAQPADPGSRLIDPLTSVTDPSAGSYVARAVDVLLHARGTGSGTHEFEVAPGVGGMTVYIACTPARPFRIRFDGEAFSGGTCDRETGGSSGIAVAAGRHTMSVHLPARAAYALLVIRTPSPTIAAGALIDPLTAVRDRRTPDALVGDTTPVLRLRGARTSAPRTVEVPAGPRRLRVLLACSRSTPAVRVRIDGHVVSGCMNSVAHWFDLTPSGRRITAQVLSTTAVPWSLLVVPAPAGAADSPENALLPYPQDRGGSAVLARGRGSGAPASGAYLRSSDGIVLLTTCRGTGWLEVSTGDGSTSTRGTACSATEPGSVGIGGGPDDEDRTKPLRWTAIPHGDISWTLTIRDAG